MHSPLRVKRSRTKVAQLPPAELQLIKAPTKGIAAANFRLLIVIFEILADLLTIALAVRLGYFIYMASSVGKHFYFSQRVIWAGGFVLAIVMVMMLDRLGAYRRGNTLLRVRETEQILRVSAQALLMVLVFSFFTQFPVPRWLIVLCLSVVPLLLFVEKNLLYVLVHDLHKRGYGNERVMIYGAGGTGRRVFSILRASPKLGLVPVALVDDDPAKVGTVLFEMGYERRSSMRISKGPVNRSLLNAHGVDMVIIAIPSISRERLQNSVDEALAANVKVSFVPSHFITSDTWIDYRDLDGVLLTSFGKPAGRLGYEIAKRAFDILVSLSLLVLGAPAYLILGLIIKLDSNGPVLFRQQRIGEGGRPFQMYKFRTMRTTASAYEYSPRESGDDRITRIGKFLRKTSLDELPQLLNVLQGNMSLVGPRPEMPFIVKRYSAHHRRRLQVTPGLTGLWQLSGDRAFLIHENIEYDLYYIQHRNFFMDLAVLLHTTIFAMRGI
jgi:exopolysaccharide biosynthesis polyprenyl glycosylphosphotransferase